MTSVAIITGSSVGLGFEVAKQLGQNHDIVVVTSRSLAKAQSAVGKLQTKSGKGLAQFRPFALDLNDFDSVTKFAAKISQEFGSWTSLVNNAGAKIERPAKTTKQGHEWHFGVNHLGHFLLTGQLMASAAPNATISTVSSITARKGDPALWPKSFEELASMKPGQLYSASKLANLVFATELNNRILHAGSNQKSVAAHPGFARAEPYGPKLLRPAEHLFAQSATSGAKPIADSILKCQNAANGEAKDPMTLVTKFEYFAPAVFELWGKTAQVELPRSALDDSLGSSLWQISEKYTGFSW